MLTHLHDDTVRIGRILHSGFRLARVFLRPTDVAVAKRDQPRRADRWQLTQLSHRFAYDLFAVRPHIHHFVVFGVDDVEMFSHISFESFHARLTGRALWIEQGLQIIFYLSQFRVSVGLNPCDIRAVIAQQLSDLRMSR